MDELILMYKEYLKEWYNTHNEGEPACFKEWFDNEFQEKK